MENLSSKENSSVNEQLETSSTLKIVVKPANGVSKSWSLIISLKSSKQSDNNWVTTFEASKEADVKSHDIHLDVVHSITENNETQTIHIQELISDGDPLVETQLIPALLDPQESSSDKLESATSNIVSGGPQNDSEDSSDLAQSATKLILALLQKLQGNSSDNLDSGTLNIVPVETQNDSQDEKSIPQDQPCPSTCSDIPVNFARVSAVSVEPWYVTRSQWGAEESTSMACALSLPIRYVVVADTGISKAHTLKGIVKDLKDRQTFLMENFGDVLNNFFVGRDGRVYEGRGWDFQSADTYEGDFYSECNRKKQYTLGISLMDYYHWGQPPPKVLKALNMIIEKGIEMGKIASDYEVYYGYSSSRNLKPYIRSMKNFTNVRSFDSSEFIFDV